MEDQTNSVFGLNIDPNSQSHLTEGAKWAKFLAIVGFVMCGLIAIFGVFAGSILTSFNSRNSELGNDRAYTAGMGIGAAILYIGIAVLYFFPCLFLYRYSVKMKQALTTKDQDTLTSSFQNLKIMFRYMGILTIVVLAFYLILILILLSVRTSSGF